MGRDDMRKLRGGERLAGLPARTWNRFIDATRRVEDGTPVMGAGAATVSGAYAPLWQVTALDEVAGTCTVAMVKADGTAETAAGAHLAGVLYESRQRAKRGRQRPGASA